MMQRQNGTLGFATLTLLLTLLSGAGAAKDFEGRVPAESGGELRIDLDSGSVWIESHSEPEVRVDAVAAGMGVRGFEFELESRDGRVRLRGHGMGGWLPALVGNGPHVRVHVRVPREFSVEVRTTGGEIELEDLEGDVKLRTSGGRVQVGRVNGDVEIETSGGPIEVDGVEGRVRARTSGGPIRLTGVEGRVRASTSGGSIVVLGATERVEAETSGGSIRVRFDDEPGGRLRTSGGSIEVELPEGEGVRLDARTSGGRVEIDPSLSVQGRVEPSKVNAEIGDGGESLRLETSGGDIRIHVR